MKNKINEKDILVSSYSFDSQGASTALKSSEVSLKMNQRKLSWVHIDGSNKNSKSWLLNNAEFLDELIIDALFAEETRPRITEFDDGMLLVLRSSNSSNISRNDDMISVRMWVSQNCIISVQKRNCKPIINVINKIESGLKVANSADLLDRIIKEIIDLTSNSISLIEDKIDNIEDELFNNRINKNSSDNLPILRKQISIQSRYILAQKEVMSHLQTNEYNWIDDWSIRNFQENYNNVMLMVEELREIKERCKIINDEIRQDSSDKMNRSMFKISVIASIFLPLGFVASLFGMNVGGIPLSSDGSGFYVVSYFMAVVFGALYLVLRNRNNL